MEVNRSWDFVLYLGISLWERQSDERDLRLSVERKKQKQSF